MKTLSFQQPWASLVCAGIKDVENRTWKAAENPGRILIHASSRKVTNAFYDENYLQWIVETQNNIMYGNVPEFKDMPTSAIIGYATVESFQDKTDSVWDSGEGIIKWVLKDAWLFDEPITGIKGKLHLFDYDLDEDNLPPAHQVQLRYPELVGTELVLPASDEAVESYLNGYNELAMDLDSATFNAAVNEDGTLKDIKTVRLESLSKAVVCDVVEIAVYPHVDDNDNPIVEAAPYDGDFFWESIGMTLSNPRKKSRSLK